MKLAVLADIHGNLPALEAVVAELDRIEPDFVVVDGDLINPVPYSAEVLDFVRATDWAVVRGNHEFYLLDFGTARAAPDSADSERWGCLHWLVDNISPDQARYLAALPDERTLYFPGTQPIRVAHGVPGRNRVGFYQQMPAEKIVPEIKDIAERTIISAHTHVQVDRHLSFLDAIDPFADPHDESSRFFDGYAAHQRDSILHWHVINPGSVGLPLSADPRAAFAVLESVDEDDEPGGWRCTHHRVDYDRAPVLDAFRTSGLLDMGGVVARLFYWELVTAEAEIIHYYHWCRDNGVDPDGNMPAALAQYQAATGRNHYVAQRDPTMKATRP
ncbi:MAG: metallophosphoesterase family protein [Caldilineaceae bacterium]